MTPPLLLFVFRYWAKSPKSAHITHVTDGRGGGGGEWGINSGFITGIVTRKHPLRIQSRVPPLNRGLGCVSQRVLLRYLVLGPKLLLVMGSVKLGEKNCVQLPSVGEQNAN